MTFIVVHVRLNPQTQPQLRVRPFRATSGWFLQVYPLMIMNVLLYHQCGSNMVVKQIHNGTDSADARKYS